MSYFLVFLANVNSKFMRESIAFCSTLGCRPKKCTFAISSPDELLVFQRAVISALASLSDPQPCIIYCHAALSFLCDN